jgi:hypothetical protein
MLQKNNKNNLALIFAILSWAALSLELYVMINESVQAGGTAGSAISSYFCYFTILTNLFVAFVFTAPLFKNNKTKFWGFFNNHNVISSATCAVIVVGLVFHFMLRNLNHLEGLQLIVDRYLHYITPVLAIIFWAVMVPAKQLQFPAIAKWLLYPIAYFGYILIRGAILHHYPYGFVDVDKIGMAATLKNSAGLFGLYIFLSAIFVSINRLRKG